MSAARVAQLPLQNPSVSDETLKPSDSAPSISLINAAAFMCASKLLGSQCYRLNLSDISTSARTATTSEEPPDLSQIPEEYHDFADVFSKSKAYNLARHRPYDLKIDIEEGATLLVSPMYQLSQVELQALRDFIEEHLCSGFIHQTSSLHGVPVLFVKKKDGGLRLCIDYHGLNMISKKDHYPLPFISDLLSTAGKARIYTTIDLRHAYHLV